MTSNEQKAKVEKVREKIENARRFFVEPIAPQSGGKALADALSILTEIVEGMMPAAEPQERCGGSPGVPWVWLNGKWWHPGDTQGHGKPCPGCLDCKPAAQTEPVPEPRCPVCGGTKEEPWYHYYLSNLRWSAWQEAQPYEGSSWELCTSPFHTASGEDEDVAYAKYYLATQGGIDPRMKQVCSAVIRLEDGWHQCKLTLAEMLHRAQAAEAKLEEARGLLQRFSEMRMLSDRADTLQADTVAFLSKR